VKRGSYCRIMARFCCPRLIPFSDSSARSMREVIGGCGGGLLYPRPRCLRRGP
jgi:hypothetical protein